MPTNEERREVAARLREKYRERKSAGWLEAQDLGIQALNYLKDLESCLPDGESLFTVLEGLIEPRTCRKVPGKMKYGDRKPKCSECGYSLGDKRWNFCPKCGCEVMGNAD